MFNWKPFGKKKLEINKKEIKKDLYLDLTINNSNWRKVSSSLLVMVFILIVGIIKVSEKNTIQTFVVERNGTDYSVLGKVEDITREQIRARSDEELIYFLKNFVEKTKSITPSVDLYKKNYDSVKSFMNKNTSAKLENYLVEGGYREKFKERKTVEVVYNTGIRLDEETFQLRWNQRIFNKNGELESSESYIGIFTINFVPVNSKETLINNPLGMLIKDYRETKEIIK